MKKLLVLALLIASVTFMFADESGFSDVVGYVKYELYANDYNMIALPMGDTGITTTLELAQAIAGAGVPITDVVESISVWDNETHGWNQFASDTPGGSFSIEPGDAFLIYIVGTTNVDFYCAGTLPSQANYDFIANDYHTVMLPLNRSDITTTLDLAQSIAGDGVPVTDVVESISTWDNETHGWKQFATDTPGGSFDINIGDGFLIYTTDANTGWNAPAGRNITTKRASTRK
jgi:hypothetical protein